MIINIIILGIVMIVASCIFYAAYSNYRFQKKIENSKKVSQNSKNYQIDKDFYYIEDFLPEEVFQKMLAESKKLKNKVKDDRFNIKNRKGIQLNKGYIYDIINCKYFSEKVKEKIGNKYYLSNFPLEYRIYPEKSRGMNWHKDVKLFDEPQYEFVYTIENESDSKTCWFDKKNHLVEQKTKPNSLIIVKADTIEHYVSPINKGYRTILKFLFTKSENKLMSFDIDAACRYNKCNII